MITAKAFAGKHFAVLGLARSGLATVEALLASGARVTAWDDKEEARERAADAAMDLSLNLDEVDLRFEDLNSVDLTQFDSIIVTPGLPLNRHPIAKRAADAGVEIIGDIELFARARPELPPHKVVGITGTNGKSTTTALIHHILKTAGVPATMGGNIGLPILAQDPLPEGGVYVLELSSYQIDLTQSLDCDVAVLLNITPDHLDRYDSFEAYRASKLRLFEMMKPPHIGVFHHSEVDRPLYDRLLKQHDFRIWSNYDDNVVDPYDLWGPFNESGQTDSRDHLSTQEDWPALQGPHNARNAIAAILACSALEVPEQQISDALQTYRGLPHRMERVRERNDVPFINDSKATNAEAAAPALAAYPRIRWIVGGQAKSETLGDTAKYLDHVVKAYTIGEAGPMFAGLLREAGVAVEECETLENAVNRAAADSQAGDTVLLSPASASFDQFRDFEARGDRFRELVEGL